LERKFKNTGTRIDIGCGKYPKPGFIGIDIKDFGQDIVWDVRHGIPFPDNSLDEVYTSHFIEHLAMHEIDDFIYELIRVCKHGARVTFRCPHSDTKEALYACHLSLWNDERVKGICHGWAGELHGWPKFISSSIESIDYTANLMILKSRKE
jgi:predicted SAM-dependent methyltransferase